MNKVHKERYIWDIKVVKKGCSLGSGLEKHNTFYLCGPPDQALPTFCGLVLKSGPATGVS